MITKAEVITALEEIVAEFGEDHVYTDPMGNRAGNGMFTSLCVYSTPEGEPSCIVGHLLHRIANHVFQRAYELEFPPGRVEEPNSYSISELLNELTFAEVEALFTYDAVAAMEEAQTIQDGGSTWGVALQAARDALEEGEPEPRESVQSVIDHILAA